MDPDNANGLCEFVDGSKAEPTCPKASIVGTATARTPILDEPLTGPVYFVKNVRKDPKSGREIRTLPKLVIPLVGQNGVKLTLTGTSDVVDDQLVTTFDNIPDAPVSSFKLNINGGKGGILAVSGADICKATQIADQQIDGQNNKTADADVYIQTPACPTKILSKKIGKTSVALKVGGLGAGKVTVTGRGHQEDDQDHHQVHGRDDHRQAHQGQARQGQGLLRPDGRQEGQDGYRDAAVDARHSTTPDPRYARVRCRSRSRLDGGSCSPPTLRQRADPQCLVNAEERRHAHVADRRQRVRQLVQRALRGVAVNRLPQAAADAERHDLAARWWLVQRGEAGARSSQNRSSIRSGRS